MTKWQMIEKKAIEYIKEHQLLKNGSHVVLGLSGGADSVCLFFILLAWKKEHDITLTAAHVHHGIRKEADADVAYVTSLCEKYDIPCLVQYEDVPAYAKANGLTEEEAGRTLRYRFFEKIANRSVPSAVIATAHHINDQAETVLFHLFRGSGITGLCGIRPQNGNIIRPLLCLTREEIEEYLKEKGISYCEDETNHCLDYTRNKIRHTIVPLATEEICQQSVAHIGKTAELMQELEEYLDEQTQTVYAECVLQKEEAILLSVEKLKKQHTFLQKQILRKAVYEQTGKRKDFSAVHIEAVLALLVKEGNGSLDLPHGLQVIKEFEVLIFTAKKTDVSVPSEAESCLNKEIVEWGEAEDCFITEIIDLEDKKRCLEVFGCDTIEGILQSIEQKTYTKWFDYDKIEKVPALRHRRSGDYLTIDEHFSKKKLKDYMIQEKIPKAERDHIKVVADGAHVMWVIGKRISTYYKLSSTTKRIWMVSYTNQKE